MRPSITYLQFALPIFSFPLHLMSQSYSLAFPTRKASSQSSACHPLMSSECPFPAFVSWGILTHFSTICFHLYYTVPCSAVLFACVLLFSFTFEIPSKDALKSTYFYIQCLEIRRY